MTDELNKVLLKNLDYLRDVSSVNKQELAKKAGVSPRMLAYIYSGERTPTLEVLERIAAVFKIAPGLLLMPDMIKWFPHLKEMGELMTLYANADADSQKYIRRVAEKEANYSAAALPSSPVPSKTKSIKARS